MSYEVEKKWGREEIIHNEEYCCKKLIYDKPVSSSLHYHNQKHETFVVASGKFELLVADKYRLMGPGDSVVLPPLTRHRLRCIVPGFIVESSTHDSPDDCVRLIPSED